MIARTYTKYLTDSETEALLVPLTLDDHHDLTATELDHPS